MRAVWTEKASFFWAALRNSRETRHVFETIPRQIQQFCVSPVKNKPMSVLIGGMVAFVLAPLLSVCLAGELDSKAPPAVSGVAAAATPPETRPDDETYGLLTLQPIMITAPAYKLPRTRAEIMKLDIFFHLNLDFGSPSIGAPFVLTPARLRQRKKNVAQSVRVFDRSELQWTPAGSLAETLLSAPEFSFSLQTISLAASSSGQGAALRGISALVLLDGVPINRPFGNGVSWAEIPREGLARAELVPSGGASAWGNGALGGVVQFLTLPARGEMVIKSGPPPDGGPPDPKLTKQVIQGTTQLVTTLGEFDTRGAEFVTSQPASNGVLQVLGSIFSTDGVPLVASERRGPIDLPAQSRNRSLEARWRQALGKGIEMVATVRGYDESSGNGTPYQQSSAHGTFASVAIAGNRTSGFAWNALAYAQSGSSASRFSAVNGTRTAEIPVIDQFAVPTTAIGASWTGAWRHMGDSRTNVGVDLRSVRGEVRQNVDFKNGISANQLFAGGNQEFAGIFVLHDQVVTPVIRATIGARIEAWNETDGHQREIESATSAIRMDKHYGTDRGTELSPSIGVVWQSTKAWRWRVTGQQSFRRPTLSERYQSFGIASIVTEANPDLRSEHNTGFEAAMEYSFYRKPSADHDGQSPALTIEAKAFRNDLRDSIGTVTVARGSGEFSLIDTLPFGYAAEKRINLDRSQVQGFQLSATWRPTGFLAIEANALLNDATILHSTIAPALNGKQMPLVSRHTGVLGATIRASDEVSFRLRVRAIGRRFVDSENTLLLGAALTVDFGVTYMLSKHTEMYLTVENLSDCRIENIRSTDGTVYVGSPRMIFGGLRLKW